MRVSDWTAVDVQRAGGQGAFVLVCEHASRAIPAELHDLGLTEPALSAHVAWDIGALDVARGLSQLLDAPLVAGGMSRLVYDCNRPLDAPGSIPGRSEVFDIPGNQLLDDAARQDRFRRVHAPFHAALADVIATQVARAGPALNIVTVHSFTPVFHGTRRTVELGFLFHSDAALANAALAAEAQKNRYEAALNAPYGPQDGVTHTLATQGEARGIPAVMVEIRNDLIDTARTAQAMAAHLADTLIAAQATLTAENAR